MTGLKATALQLLLLIAAHSANLLCEAFQCTENNTQVGDTLEFLLESIPQVERSTTKEILCNRAGLTGPFPNLEEFSSLETL